jgi:hypothetical protein
MRDDKTKPTNELQKYSETYNALFLLIGGDFSQQNLKTSLKKSPIETVRQYFQREKNSDSCENTTCWAKMFKADMDRHPARVRRLNELAVLANSCSTAKKLLAINSEVEKLLYGDKSGGGK